MAIKLYLIPEGMIENVIDNIRQTRKNMLSLMESFSFEELCFIPSGMNNHLLWNFGHSIITQHILTYGLAGLDHPVEEAMLLRYRKGSNPKDLYYPESDFPALSRLSVESLDGLVKDCQNKVFTNFKPYETSYGVILHSIEGAIVFNAQHEALHLGYMMAQRRILSH